jgi:hypothetical protein
MRTSSGLVALLTACAVLSTAPLARAGSVDCTTLPNPPVYISGGSAAKPHLLALAAALAQSGINVSLIYSAPTACIGLEDVVASPAQTESTTPSYLNPSTTPPTAESCTAGADPYPAFYADIGVSGAYPSSCITPTITLGSGYQDFQGPIEAFEIATPWGASQNSINAEAAYVVFGYGGQNYTVSPWIVPANIWTRGVTSAVQLIIGDAIGLSGAKWLYNTGDAGAAQVLTSETTMVTTIANAGGTATSTTIGILGSGALDPYKFAPTTNDAGVKSGGIQPLAFQATDQDCAYYADSDVSHFDKINVRQGRYDIWGPEHFVTAVDSSGNPQANPAGATNPPQVASTSANVQAVISFITHATSGDLPFPLATVLTPTELQTVIAAESNAHFIPECAMQVSRTSEVGSEASYQPTQGCGCYFESVTGKGTTLSSYCQTCTSKSDCTNASYPACNFGYCEAQ